MYLIQKRVDLGNVYNEQNTKVFLYSLKIYTFRLVLREDDLGLTEV